MRSWKQRNSIPPGHWLALVKLARARGIKGVTLEVLALIAERATRPPPANASSPTSAAEGRAA
ncbi:hypothetical protein ACIU1J_27545 [Azospirillum doebereinerae]|uniref:hypothetical protein n=1 Tax=Azospirillum doebereinerae TaxID=92933 RepID=UPI00384A4891